MLRAATAASGGTGAPDWTYCSIWPWTVCTRASTSRSSGAASSRISTSAEIWPSVESKPTTRRRCWPWTMARTVPSWACTTWAILARVPTSYSSSVLSMSSRSAWRWVTSAMSESAATALSRALTDFSRPTCRGTIISGKMTVSRSATSGSTRGPLGSLAVRPVGDSGVPVVLSLFFLVAIQISLEVRSGVGVFAVATGLSSEALSGVLPADLPTGLGSRCTASRGCASRGAPPARRGRGPRPGSRPGSG